MRTSTLCIILLSAAGLAGCGSERDNSPSSVTPPNDSPTGETPADTPPNETTTPPAEEPGAQEPPGEAPAGDEPTGGQPSPPEAPPTDPEPTPPPAQEPPSGLPAEEAPPPDGEGGSGKAPVDEPEPPTETPPVKDPEPVATLHLDAEIASEGVAPNGKIVLIADRALDETSVTEGVELRDAETTEVVPATAGYDVATRRVTIAPARKLDEGNHYAVHVKSARDAGGSPVEVSGQSTARVKKRIYSRVTIYKEDGTTPKSVSHFGKVGNNQALKVYYNGPGEDGVWFEEEDEISRYEVTRYLPDNVQTVFMYNGPGEDGAWFDDNDQFERAWRYRHANDGRIMERLQTENAGADGDFFTGDDHYRVAEFRVYDENGKLTLSLYRSATYPEEMSLNPGADGKWLTGDDGAFVYDRYEYGETGRRVRRVGYSSRSWGTDDIAFNGDDAVLNYTDFFYDEAGQLLERHNYHDPGINGTWFNDDDRAGSVDRIVRIASVVLEEFRDAGVDGRPNTEDDRLKSYFHKEHDELGRLIRNGTYHRRGDDGEWHTSDDEPFGAATIYSYHVDESGRPITKAVGLAGNGDDERRFSGDEETTSFFLRSYDETSQLARTRIYLEPGFLPGWEDGDEILFGDTEYLDAEE